MGDSASVPTLTLEGAQRVLEGSLAHARSIGVRVCIAVADRSGDPPVLTGIVKTDRLIVFGGGVPIRSGGALAGAVGVSGGSSEQDRAIAEAGAALIS